MNENNNEKETTVFDLTNPLNREILKIDEDFWGNVWSIFFNSTHVEITSKDFITHIFLHYWFYERVQDPSQAYSQDDKSELWKVEDCKYCFIKGNEEFLNWFYEQAKERNLIDKTYG